MQSYAHVPKVKVFGTISVTTAFVLGIYGRRRHKFASDKAYAKFHYGILIQMASTVGMYNTIRIPYDSFKPVGGLFMFAFVATCLPAYYYGLKDIHL